MIAIGRRHFLQDGAHDAANQEMFELLLGGDQHWDLTVANIFFRARLVAALALSENSKPALIISALLVHPCQILASGCYQAGDWSSDSLYESGTYDWLIRNFGEEIADTVRLSHAAKRFLATVIPKYYGRQSLPSQKLMFSEGGFMSVAEREAFCKNRFHNNAVKVVGWIDKGVDRCLEVPEMSFFIPFVQRAIVPVVPLDA